MDGATDAAFKEMCRVVKFVLDTKEFYGLQLQSLALLKVDMVSLTMYTNSDWAGDIKLVVVLAALFNFLWIANSYGK
jgi:hypothetical protein